MGMEDDLSPESGSDAAMETDDPPTAGAQGNGGTNIRGGVIPDAMPKFNVRIIRDIYDIVH